jgi:predicted AAA+ superfamily ATPase
VRNLQNFSRFFEDFAFSNTELTNYSNISRDCGVNANTVKDYYQILEDTLVGHFIYTYSKTESRDTLRSTPKFYLSDVGLATYLAHGNIMSLKGPEAGKAFENFIFMELIAYRDLKEKNFTINFWRNKNKLEVDFIIDRAKVAIEVKISNSVH